MHNEYLSVVTFVKKSRSGTLFYKYQQTRIFNFYVETGHLLLFIIAFKINIF